MALTFPVTCTIGHATLILTDDPALISHHASEHAGTPILDYKASLVSSASSAPPPPGAQVIKKKPHASALAKLGLTKANLHNVKAKEVTSSGHYNEAVLGEYIKHLSSVYGFDFDPHRFYLDLFILLLEHGGTDDVRGLHGTTLYAVSGSQKEFVSWETVKKDSVEFFIAGNMTFTFRKFVYSLDDAFWEMWTDPDVEALDSVRNYGTSRSRNWTMPDGSSIPAYVVVPDMFNSHLTPGQREVRKAYRYAAGLEKGNRTTVDYTGATNVEEVEDAIHTQSLRNQESKMNKLWKGSGGSPGVGDPLYRLRPQTAGIPPPSKYF